MSSKPRPQDLLRQPFRLPGIEPPSGSPYDALAAFGVGYGSPMAAVHRGSLRAQKEKRLTAQRKQAWKELRDSERRLVLDLLYVQPDPTVFGESAGAGEPKPELRPPALELPDAGEPPPADLEELQEPPEIELDRRQLLWQVVETGPPAAALRPPSSSFLEEE